MKRRLISLFLSLVLLCSTTIPAAALDISQIKDLLEQYYVDDIPPQIMEQENLQDLLSALNDPYTGYYTSKEYQQFFDSVNGTSFVGIGVSFSTTYDNGYKILEILPNSPALEAGIHAGDFIIAVDGVPMTETSNAQTAITGEEGSNVAITLRRGDTGSEDTLTLVRRLIRIPIVTYTKTNNIGFIDCTSFGESTATEVLNGLRLLEDDVTVWVMDLSQNSGGIAEAAASTASYFTGGGPLVYFQYQDKHQECLYTPQQFKPVTEHPLILLLGPLSASASELTAAAVRDYQSGISIGQRSYGKGISQVFFNNSTHPELFEDDSLRVTTARFYSPNETTNHLVGVLPTLSVPINHAKAIASLLSAPAPVKPNNHLKLELAGHTFYINRSSISQENNREAFTYLLEALPPSATLYQGLFNNNWYKISPLELALFLELDFTPRTYQDIGKSPYKNEINTLAVYELLPQYSDAKLLPTQEMTRGEFCELVANALNLPANLNLLSSFSDLSSQSPHASAVSALLNRGFISGDDSNTFRPDSLITFEEAACILSRAASWLNLSACAIGERGVSIGEWLDYYDYEDWAEDAVWHLTQLNISLQLMAPGKTVTREEGTAMLYQLMDSLGLFWN